MRLYVVLADIDYEAFDTFMGVYSTRELAEARIMDIGSTWDSVRILETNLDEDHKAI